MVTLGPASGASRDSLWLLFQAPICEDAPATSTGMCPEIESRSQQQQTTPYISFVLVLQLISDGTRVFLSPAESELDTVVEP